MLRRGEGNVKDNAISAAYDARFGSYGWRFQGRCLPSGDITLTFLAPACPGLSSSVIFLPVSRDMFLPGTEVSIALLGFATVLLAPWMLLYRPAGEARGAGPDEDFRPPVSNDPPPTRLRVATYNIKGDSCDLERIAQDLEAVGADVIGLQEVHDTYGRPDQLRWLARRLEMAMVRAPVCRRCGRYHRNNGLLTKLPVGHWQRIPLAGAAGKMLYTGSQRRLIRQLLCVDLLADRPLRVLVTHLSTRKTDPMPGGRPAQLEQVLRELAQGSPALLLGDLNTPRGDPSIDKPLARIDALDALGGLDPHRVDWIVARGVTAKAAGHKRSGASDHPLYWCDIEL